jgi:DNA-binding MarR family transcriptional regulator
MQQQKRVLQYDAFTGEQIEGTMAFFSPKRKNGFKTGWLAMEQVNALRAFANANFTNEDRRVWAILMSYVNFENLVDEQPSVMAEELGITRSNFTRSLNKLCDEGVFLRRKVNGRTVKIWLNPEYGWKGSSKNHIIALSDFRRGKFGNVTTTAGPEPHPPSSQ